MDFLRNLFGKKQSTIGSAPDLKEVPMPGDAFTRLDAQKKTWIGWDRNRLIRAFGQPVTSSGGPGSEWLGFRVEGCSVTMHIVNGIVTSAEVWSS